MATNLNDYLNEPPGSSLDPGYGIYVPPGDASPPPLSGNVAPVLSVPTLDTGTRPPALDWGIVGDLFGPPEPAPSGAPAGTADVINIPTVGTNSNPPPVNSSTVGDVGNSLLGKFESSGSDLLDLFSLNPAYLNEYNRVSSAGDTRSPIQWMQDFLLENPGEIPGANELLNNARGAATGTQANAGGGLSFTDLVAYLATLNPLSNSQPPSETYNITNAPVTNFDYNPITFLGFSASDVSDLLSSFGERFANLLNIPNNRNVTSPANPPQGYAVNVEQSQQRQGFQTVASVTGLTGGQTLGGKTPFPIGEIVVGAILGFLIVQFFKYFK